MRVISGTAKGTKLDSLDTLETRPTLDRVKEALFNIIQTEIYDSIILDLFAGSGALGIECLSRGAKKAIFCDKSKEAYNIIKRNVEKTRLNEKTVIFNKDYDKCLDYLEEKFDIVFIDPPYNTNLAVDALSKILEKKLLSDKSIVVIETDDEKRILGEVVNIGVQVIDVRKYGRVKLVFLKRKE